MIQHKMNVESQQSTTNSLLLDERDVFMRGTTIVLKALSEDDVVKSGWYGWFNDEETTEFMQQRFFPNTLHNQLEFYRSTIAHLPTSTKVQVGILPYGTAMIVGVVSLSAIDFLNRKAEFAIIIGDKDVRGKGYGTEAAELILKHGFERLSLNKIYLGVHAGHKAAIRSYEKAGFKIDGVLREDILLGGRFYDTVQMSILARDWNQQRAKNL